MQAEWTRQRRGIAERETERLAQAAEAKQKKRSR
jgi:hypothetical protein